MSDETLKPPENEKLSSALNEILSNPQMLSTIASMAQGLKNSSTAKESTEEKSATEESKNIESAEAKETATAAIPSALTELLGNLSNSGASKSRQSELLCALKPYLSQSRADAIDKIIRFSELSNLFKGLT